MVRSRSGNVIKEIGGVTLTSLIRLLQSFLFKIANFLVNLVGINWLFGLFGLALKPIDERRYPKEDDFDEDMHAVKENKRNHAVMSEDFDFKENSTKRCKPDDDEKSASENDDFGLYKKPVDDDRAKAISDFQNRLWNLKPDLNFVEKNTVQVVSFDEEGDSIRNLKVTIDETEKDKFASKPIRDEIYKKVIKPSESFDDVLNMSEDVSEIPTGDEFSDVISDIVVEEDVKSLVEDEKDVVKTVTALASEPDMSMDPSSPCKKK